MNMKRIKLLALMALCVILSCQKADRSDNVANPSNNANGSLNSPKRTLASGARMESNGPFSQYITMETANQMINSYLASVNYPANDSDLQSLIFNADSLRAYLNSNPNIKQVKFMFAHTMDYINAGNYGVNCGYQTGELTMIVAGFDGSNNYVYAPGNMVLEHAQPCPSFCPSSGNASYAILK
jgi:hypothetical protein